jgi:hypothetical protein
MHDSLVLVVMLKKYMLHYCTIGGSQFFAAKSRQVLTSQEDASATLHTLSSSRSDIIRHCTVHLIVNFDTAKLYNFIVSIGSLHSML